MNTEQLYLLLMQKMASKIKRTRKARGLTQEALAGKCGLAIRHLQKIEAGEVNITLQTVAKLSCALSISPKYLFQLELDGDCDV